MFTGVHPFLRRLHIWIGLLILFPTIVVTVTAILLAHDKDLGLKRIHLSVDWLPASWVKQESVHQAEIKAYLQLGTDTALIGSKAGLFLLEKGTLSPVAGMQHLDIRALYRWQGEVFVAAKQGVWLSAHGRWHQLYHGDAHGLDIDADGNLYLAAHKRGLLVSHDGGDSWQSTGAAKQLGQLVQNDDDQQFDIKKLIKGLHSGQLIVGKSNEWIWIDAISGLLLLTSLIGTYRWWKKRNIY